MTEKKNFKIHNIEQKSEEWWNLRELRLTASHAQAIGNMSTGLNSYITKKMAEYFSNGEPERYMNRDIIRGNELEDMAISMYEMETGYEVKKVGFVEKGEHVGCSPDGLVYDSENDEKGLVEIKCPKDLIHYEITIKGRDKIKSKYLWQVQMQMLVTEREWCDLVYYNPNYTKNIVRFRIEIDEKKQKKLKKGLKKGVKQLKEHLENYDKGNKAEEIFE